MSPSSKGPTDNRRAAARQRATPAQPRTAADCGGTHHYGLCQSCGKYITEAEAAQPADRFTYAPNAGDGHGALILDAAPGLDVERLAEAERRVTELEEVVRDGLKITPHFHEHKVWQRKAERALLADASPEAEVPAAPPAPVTDKLAAWHDKVQDRNQAKRDASQRGER